MDKEEKGLRSFNGVVRVKLKHVKEKSIEIGN
jgi:hypothetical protein